MSAYFMPLRGDKPIELPQRLNVLDKGYLYGLGKKLEIVSHQPPCFPFDDTVGHVDQETLRARTPRDHVFLKVPSEKRAGSRRPSGKSAYFEQEDSATLVVTHCLAIGDATGPTGAQVVLCEFGKQKGRVHKPTAYWNKMGHNERPTRVVAKIYDPLLQFKVNYFRPENRRDVVNCAEYEYAREASAYAELHEAAKTKPIIKDFVPRFYGTWTTTIKNTGWGQSDTRPGDSNDILHERPVRIVLLEYIEGRSIWSICNGKDNENNLIPPKIDSDDDFKHLAERMDVFARILYGLVALDHVGVIPHHYMPATRFIIESPNSPAYVERRKSLGKHRVVLIGFSMIEVTRYSEKGPRDDEHFPRPRHPLCSHYTPSSYSLQFLSGWFPPEWADNLDLFFNWAEDGHVFDPKDFTCEDEICAIVEKVDAERPPEPKKLEKPSTFQLLGYTGLPRPSTGPFSQVPGRASLSQKSQKTDGLKVEEAGRGADESASSSSAGTWTQKVGDPDIVPLQGQPREQV